MEIFTYRAVEPDKEVYFLYAPTMKRVIMRMSIIIFILAFGFMHAAGNADAQQVTLNVKNEKLADVFRKLREQTGYLFNFRYSQVDKFKVSFSVENTTIVKALDQCLEGLPLTYTIIDKIIVIREKTAIDSLKSLQLHYVTGIVTDVENEPLIGVTVRIKGSNLGTTTDNNGIYRIQADPNGVIEFSMVGYHLMSIKINSQISIDVTMVASMTALTETVVKGYYTTTKELNTGNVSTVKGKDIIRQPVSDPVSALIGRVPGLFVQQTSGISGRQLNVQLRGQNSLDNGNNPLYIVDGVQFISSPMNSLSTNQFTAGGFASPFNYLNPNDIESITILKDADATAIYGSRGSNGVILINTKKGQQGKMETDFSVYGGIGSAPHRVTFMELDEYLSMRQSAFNFDNTSPGNFDYDLNDTWSKSRETDWQETLIGGTSPIFESSLGISGGSRGTSYRLSASHRHEGTVYPEEFSSKRSSFHFNSNHVSINKKFNIALATGYVSSNNSLPSSGIERYITLAPNAPALYDENGEINWENSTWGNPLAVLKQTSNENARNLLGNLTTSYRLFHSLSLKATIGYNILDFAQKNLRPSSAFDPALVSDPPSSRLHQLINNSIQTWNVEPQLAYSREMFGGNFDATIGLTYQRTAGNYTAMTGSGFASDAIMKNFAAATQVFGLSRSNTVYKYSAAYARLGYVYNERYILNLTARRDGSSRFGPGNQFGNFGSIGAAWVISKENFLLAVPWISLAKLRISYGTTGNDQLGEYKYLDTYSAFNIQYQRYPSIIPTQLTNPFYGWERVNKKEIAVEISLLNNRLAFSSSLWQNRTKNQLVQYAIPSIAGFSSVRANLPAVIQNSGIELEFYSQNINSRNFKWASSFNLTIPRNKLVSFPSIEASTYARRFVVGKPINSIAFLYHYIGKNPNTKFYNFEDLNHDGAFTTTMDQRPVFIGQKFYGGLQNNLQYRNFELDFLLQFTKQNGYAYLINGIPGFLNQGRGNQPTTGIKRNIVQPFTQGNFDIYTQTDMFQFSDGIITDASYIRLKNISLTYSINLGSSISRVLEQLQAFALAQNLITFTNYLVFDPENPSPNIILPALKVITLGIRTKF